MVKLNVDGVPCILFCNVGWTSTYMVYLEHHKSWIAILGWLPIQTPSLEFEIINSIRVNF